MLLISHRLSTHCFPSCFHLLQRHPPSITSQLTFLSLKRHPMNLETQVANPAGFSCTDRLDALNNNLYHHFSKLMLWSWTSEVWLCFSKPSEQPRTPSKPGKQCRSIRPHGLLFWIRKPGSPDGSYSSTSKVCIVILGLSPQLET